LGVRLTSYHETSVTNHNPTPRNITKERRPINLLYVAAIDYQGPVKQ